MKVRNGFVSNSSSSSFLVGISDRCHTLDDFIDNGIYRWEAEIDEPVEDWEVYTNECMTNHDCIKKLWEDLLTSNQKANMNDWIDSINGGDIPESNLLFGYTFVDTLSVPYNVANIYREEYGDKLAKTLESRLLRLGKDWNSIVGEAMIKEMFRDYDGDVYEIHYSDNESQIEALMEHGAFWNMVPHVKIGHH